MTTINVTAYAPPVWETLTLSASSVDDIVDEGAPLADILGAQPGSTFTVTDDSGGQVALSSGGQVTRGATALNNAVSDTLTFTVEQAVGPFTRSVTFTMDVTTSVVIPPTGPLGLTFTSFASGEATDTKLAEITGGAADSTFSLADDDGGRLKLSGRRLLRGAAALTGPASRSVTINEHPSGGGSPVPSTIDYTVRAAPTPPVGLIATSRATSISYRGATYSFSQAVTVGTYANGEPFVVSDPADGTWTILEPSPAATQITTGTYERDLPNSNSYQTITSEDLWVNGAMANPYFTDSTQKQGFSEFLARTAKGSLKNSQEHLYDDNLRLKFPYTVTPGHEVSIVKSIHRTGLVTPSGTSEKHFDAWSVLHVVAQVPGAGAFPPGVSALTKESEFFVHQLNKDCLPGPFSLPSGWPTIADTLVDPGPYIPPFYWHFGKLKGEQRRRYNTGTGSGYSGGVLGFGTLWSEQVAAILAAGPSISDAALYNVVQMGITYLALYRRGYRGHGGAGQGAGHHQVLALFRHLFPDHPGLNGLLWDFNSNARGQVAWGLPTQEGKGGPWPGNHSRYWEGLRSGDVGKPIWGSNANLAGPPANGGLIAGIPGQDYEITSGIPCFLERLNIALLQNGPGGFDGATLMAENKGWGTDNIAAAMFAYMFRYRTYPNGSLVSQPTFKSTNQGGPPDHRQFYDAHIGEVQVPKWEGPPECIMPYQKSQIPLTAGAGSFTWNWLNLGGDDPAADDWETQWSYDEVAWFDVADFNDPASTETGLCAGILHYVRYRRHNTHGWAEWSLSMPYTTTGGDRFVVTPTGTPSGAVTNLVAPAPGQRRYQDTKVNEFVPAVDGNEFGRPIYLGLGKWSGAISGTPTIAVEIEATLNAGDWAPAAGLPVPEGPRFYYKPTKAEAGKRMRYSVTWSGVTAWSSPLLLGALPSLPAGTIIDWTGSYEDNVLFEEVIASFQANSINISQLVVVPSAAFYTTVDPDDEEEPVLLADGVMYGKKSAPQPALRGNIAASIPVVPGEDHHLEFDAPIGVLNQSGSTNDWDGNLKWAVGYTPGGAQYSPGGVVQTVSRTGQPMPKRITADFTAAPGQTEVWLMVQCASGTGKTAGGNPMLDSISLVQTS